MKSSFSRNFTTAAAILLLALTILGASFQFQVKEFLEDSTISHLVQDAGVISDLASAYIAGGDLSNQDFLLNLNVVSKVTNADAVICDGDGYIILCSDALAGCQHQGLQLNREYLEKVYYNGSDTSVGVIEGLYAEERYIVSFPIVSQDVNQGLVIVSYPTRVTTQTLSRISNIFLTAAIFVVLISVLAVMAFARRETKPLRDMAKAANAFAHGNLKARVRVEEDYSEEVEELALAFNNMASSLQKSEYRRQEFVANVSHELKTPMTSMKVLADSLVGQSGVPEELYQEFMHDITAEIDRENRIITDLLTLVKMDKKTADLQIQHMDINQLLEDILKRLRPIADKRKIDLILDSFRPVEADVDEIKFTSAISNLVENGIKYNVDEGWVRVSLDADHKYFYVTVADSGMGIPEDSLDRIFERFYRVDKSHSREIGGTGLGLAITRSTIAMHHGVIKVFSREGEGTTFSVRIPLSYIP